VKYRAREMGGRAPGKNWLAGFLRRHPEVRLGKARNLDPKRAQAFNRPVVHFHFDLLAKLLAENNIPLENMYNMDEKGCQRGGGKKQGQQMYFIPRTARGQYKPSPDNLELVTIVECVAADGGKLQPGFIFAGKKYHKRWFESGVPNDVTVSLSPNGWTNDHLCTAWFETCFIPQAKARNTTGEKILLIFDGHGSHTTPEIIDLAIENNIILYCLPAHTTHKLQPLDVGVFGPFSDAWIRKCNDWAEQTDKEMPRGEFVREYI
ncbi:DDE-domain-containing protein, partial [Schizophyllum commune Loenen D]